MANKKEIRKRVWNKYGCQCAYCGKKLEYDKMQVDHIKPLYRNDTEEDCLKMNVVKGIDEESNYNPSCARCNRWKSTFNLEQFRNEISLQLDRLRKSSSNYRMALDFGLIKEVPKKVVFHFEIYGKVNWLVPAGKGYNDVVPEGDIIPEIVFKPDMSPFYINGYKRPCVGCNEECMFTCTEGFTIEPKCLKDGNK
ncbi:HNH endonuclease [Tenacibaculum phage Gundel_1]|uniref:HNH endonuclease n=1 Tax=Tenacibaculum phage Gundel_1 TaxID=2745672 RepID=A0A8E5EBK2_9CAUD|nr:HNH endonuclease [Tenacibaculum phage Gundel_1]QQV91436.1 HNH endonuclease [Tenacibaculum phage Gundel_1]